MNKKEYVEANALVLESINNFERLVVFGAFYALKEDLDKLYRMRSVLVKLCNEASEGIFQDIDFCVELKKEIVDHMNSLIYKRFR